MNTRIRLMVLSGLLLLAPPLALTQGQRQAPKEQAKPSTPTPAPSPPAAARETPSEMKAFADAMKVSDPEKKIEALEKVLIDFPKAASMSSMAHSAIFDTLVKSLPDKKDRILAQANKVIESTPEPIRSSSYNTVATKLMDAGILLDEAEQFASKGLSLVEEEHNKRLRTSRASYLATLGRIYLKKGKNAEAEKALKDAYAANPQLTAAAVGMAEISEKAGNDSAAIDYLAVAALSGRMPAEAKKKLEALYQKTHNGSLDGLDAMLDAKYRSTYPSPIKVDHYKPTSARTNRVVLAEVFTGSGCPPCVAADLGFDVAMERYSRSDFAVVMYHLHIPAPDPMTNPSTQARSTFYGVRSVPSFLIDGVLEGGGGPREATKDFFDRINPKIEKALEAAAEAEIKIEAALDQSTVKVKALVDKVKADSKDLKLQIALVEDLLTYSGENGVRFHPMVVRSLGGDKAGGFALSGNAATVEHTFDLAKIKDEIKAHLDDYEVNGRHGKITFSEKKHVMNSQSLSVVAFVQDEKSKRILQSVYAKVKTAAMASTRQ